MKICAIILAAGSGKRMELETNKVFIKFEEQSAVIRCLKTFGATELFSDIIVVCKKEECDIVKRKVDKYIRGNETIVICEGGSERQYSVRNALEFVPEDADIVVVHDAARCFVTERIIRDCVSSAIRHGSGVAAVAPTDTIKRAEKGLIVETLPREKLVCVQTPQAFKKEMIFKAHEKAEKDSFLGTDDASIIERLGIKVHAVTGSPDNIKLTTRKDVDQGRKIVQSQQSSDLRIGNGFDVHQFAAGRKLVLGGVEIPSDIGLDGHSDADVLVHAVMDALLGAARLGDIGGLFPDTDPKYKNIYSIKLLCDVGDLLRKYGYKIINIDSTIIMQKPKINIYREQMMDNVASALDMAREYVNIKATTTEYLGAVGRGEGAAAQAVCILQKQNG